jgi:hypothetical protein
VNTLADDGYHGVRGYNARMDPTAPPPISPHDATLIDWFLSLQPAERLAELESRLAFFASAHPNDDAQLPPDTRAL